MDWESYLKADAHKARRFRIELLKRDLFVTPGGKTYLSPAHRDEDLDRALNIFENVLGEKLHWF